VYGNIASKYVDHGNKRYVRHMISYIRKYKYGDAVSLYLPNLPQAVAAAHFNKSSSRETPGAPFLLQTDLAFNVSSNMYTL
jgi:hypothetical protein